jgi:hypothetical protein
LKPSAVAAELEEALGRLGVRVRRERGAFRGGLCRVGGEDVVVLNRAHPPEAQVAALAGALRAHPGAEGVWLRPAVRAALDDVEAGGLAEGAAGDDAAGGADGEA